MTEALLVWPVRVGFCLVAAFLLVFSATADAPPAGVSGEEWASIQKQIESERHAITKSDRPGATYRADNPTQRFTAHFGAEDVVISPSGRGEPAWELNLRLTAWGAAHDLKQINFASVTSESNRIEYRRGALTEWYLNTAMGLEQGFTIEAPSADDITELVLEMTIDSDLIPELADSGQAVTFRKEDSTTTLTYSGLKAWDAVEAPLEARIELAGDGARLRLVVEVAGAAWPITVDPIFALVAKLLPTPDSNASGANFGQCVAIHNDLLVAGIRDPEQGEESGAAHLFRRDPVDPTGWNHVAKLLPEDGAAYDFFGFPVDIYEETIVVGAARDDDIGTDSGSAYVFQRESATSDFWSQVVKLTPADGAEGDWFGHMVSISDDTIIVGAVFDDDHGADSGSAYVFGRDHGGQNAWGQVAKLTAGDGAAYDYFANFAYIDGDTVVVGASLDDDSGSESGSAYIFERNHDGANAWGQVTKLTTTDVGDNDWFGFSVSIHQDVVVIGAPGYYYSDSPGSAFVFLRDHGGPNAWGQVTELSPIDGEPQDRFGVWLSIDGDTIIVGASGDDDHDLQSGSAYIFQRDHGGPGSWGQVAKITAPDGEEEDYFGSRVSIGGDTAVIGVWSDDDKGPGSGSVYSFGRNQGGADSWGFVGKVVCPPVLAAREDFFGAAAVSGDTIVAGAHGDDENGIDSGAAYLFYRDQGAPDAWGREAKIAATDPGEGDHFGGSTAIAGDTVIAGARHDDDNGADSGSAYIFRRDQGGSDAWGQVAKITPVEGTASENFGHSVSISHSTAIVGTWGDDLGPNSGSAYIFLRDQGGPEAWGQVAKIIPIDGAEGDHFGTSVFISGDTAIVGSCLDDDNGSNSGSAYIFQQNLGGTHAWGLAAKITPDDGQEGDRFGCDVSIHGDTAIVGAGEDDDNGDRSGSAYIFQRHQGGTDAWGQVAKIVPADGGQLHLFGESVAVFGNTAIVGAHNDPVNGSSTGWGSAYVFRRDQGGVYSWGQVAKITPTDGTDDDHFGGTVAIDANTSVIGAVLSDSLGLDSGAAYVYTISDAFFADGFETGDTSAWSVVVP